MRFERNSMVALAVLVLLVAARAQEPAPPAAESSVQPDPNPDMVTDTPVPATVEAAIAQLAAQNFFMRDGAEHFLMQQPPDQLAVIELALVTSQDPEATLRLTRIATHLYLKSRTHFQGRASLLGITLNLQLIHRDSPDAHDEDPRMAVAVMDLQLGFPAAEVLRPGDLIIAINHESFGPELNIESFRRQVNTSPPGTVMLFTILRDRRQMDLPVKLAGVPDGGAAAIAEFVSTRRIEAQTYLQRVLPHCPTMLVIHSEPRPEATDSVVIDGGQ